MNITKEEIMQGTTRDRIVVGMIRVVVGIEDDPIRIVILNPMKGIVLFTTKDGIQIEGVL